MQIQIFQVDAFTDRPFAGNPAAVCPLDSWLSAEVMLAIAAENNLSETAFVVPVDNPRGSDSAASYELRWFTPKVEVDLCGHATLAAGHVVLTRLTPEVSSVSFDTRSGPLTVERASDGSLCLELPTDPRQSAELPNALRDALGVEPVATLGGSTWIVVLDRAQQVAELTPDISAIAALEPAYLSVTAPGEPESGIDFVSRFFAPGAGIDEDPVTGSAHCALMAYWAERLGCSRLRARQLSERGGELDCELRGNRVYLRGRCVEVLEGVLSVPAELS